MVKGIDNAFDHTELRFVINLTKHGNWAITRPPVFATGYVSFVTTFLYQVAGTCYLRKKLISNIVKEQFDWCWHCLSFHQHLLDYITAL